MSKDELVKLLEDVSTKAASAAVTAEIAKIQPSIDRANKFIPKSGFASRSEEDISKLSAKQKTAEFIKAVFNKDMAALSTFNTKALTEGTGSNGGFLVPEEFATQVFRLVQDFGLVPKLARTFPMMHDTLNVPRMASTVNVSWPGEAVAGTPSYPVFEQVHLITKTLVGITPMSNELLADANVDVVDFLLEIFAEAIAGELDKQGFVGTGAPFTGILNTTGITVVQPGNGTGMSTFTGASIPDNARTLISSVIPWALQGAAFFMHRSVWALFQTTKAATTGNYLLSTFNPVMTDPSKAQGYPLAMAGTMWGYPVYLSDKLPGTTAVSTKYVIFGSLKFLALGQREELSVAISQDATVGTDNLFAATCLLSVSSPALRSPHCSRARSQSSRPQPPSQRLRDY